MAERDIAKYWQDGNIRICLYGLENQTAVDSDIPLRVASYDGAGYRAQLLADKGRKKEGRGRKPKEWPPRYPVVTLVRIVADYFVQMRVNKDCEPSRETIRHVHEVLQLMRVLSGNRQFEDAQNAVHKDTTKGGCSNMYNVLARMQRNR